MEAQGKLKKRLMSFSINSVASLAVFKPCIWGENEIFYFLAPATE